VEAKKRWVSIGSLDHDGPLQWATGKTSGEATHQGATATLKHCSKASSLIAQGLQDAVAHRGGETPRSARPYSRISCLFRYR
jgi:hypothetical protein